MKLEVLQENFLEGLNAVNRIIPSRPSVLILSQVQLSGENGALTLVGSDGDTSIRTTVGAKIISEGTVCVPAKQLFDLVASLGEGKIELKNDDQALYLKTANFEGKILAADSKDYPQIMPANGQDVTWEMESKLLLKSLERVVFATSQDDSRPALSGVYWKQKEHGLLLAATDLFRLSIVELPQSLEEKEPIVVPVKVLTELQKTIVGKKAPSVLLAVGKNEISFVVGETKLISRLITATFPNCEKIIPTELSFKVTLSVGPFLKAVRTAAVFGRENSNIIKLHFSPEQEFELTAFAKDIGEQAVRLDVEISGEVPADFHIAFNYRYLIDLLTTISTPDLLAHFTTPLTPVVFKIPGESSFTHLIMPFRV